MASYQVYCSECDTECSVNNFDHLSEVPAYCTFCGNELDETNVRNDDDENDEEDWNKLAEESLDDIEDFDK